MTGTTLSHCAIPEKSGEGGMGVGDNARELELNRIVALIFLPDRHTAKRNDALVYFRRIADIDPRSSSMLEEVAETQLLVRNHDKTRDLFVRIVQLAPDIAVYCYSSTRP